MIIGSGIRNNKSIVYLVFVVLLFVFVSGCSSYSSEREQYSINGATMGTTYSVKVILPKEYIHNLDLQEAIDSVLSDVNEKMSTYISDSELSLFNQNQGVHWIDISNDLAHVISTSIMISKESNGSFDITVGPLVNLWGFGPTKNDSLIPKNSEVSKILSEIGIDNLELDLINLKIRKKIPQIYCDLSAIAKGYGVDKVGLFLESIGLNEYMIEIGGEVRVKGMNKDNKKWKIGISSPSQNNLQQIIGISNLSMATSGDYFNYFEVDNIRYSHTIDPRTGRPIKHKLASVTVIHQNCEMADAYATAIDVMGPEEGFKFALAKELPIFMIVREENYFIEKMTPQFEEFIQKD